MQKFQFLKVFELFKRDYYIKRIIKIWFEALTGKQAILFHHLANKFEEAGHQIIISSRNYDYTESNLTRLGRDFVSIGKYGGASFKDKLITGSQRIIALTKVIDEYKPDILISFPSPDAFRTAFGLGIPSIQLNDTPHARAVGKLTISLSNALIHPEAIKSSEFGKYGITQFYPYAGIDEVLWVKTHKNNIAILDKLQIEREKYVVVRCEESKSAYFQDLYPSIRPGSTILVDIISKLKEYHKKLDIVAFPRYPEQEEVLKDSSLIIPDKSVDTLSLFAFARAVMTAGGTMGRESALLGTPTIYSFPLELAVSDYIYRKGFPLHHCPNHLNVPKQMIKLLKYSRMDETLRKKMLSKLKTPFDALQKAIKNIMSVEIV